MPKLKENQVPAYRLHKQSGQAIVTLSGRDHLLGEHDTAASRGRYDRLIGEWLANGRRPNFRTAGRDVSEDAVDGVTVSRLVAEFWHHAKTYYASPAGETKGTEADNFRFALRPLRHLYGATPAAAFGPRSLTAVRQEMIRLGWSRTHVNRQVARIKQAFKWAVAEEIVPASVYHALVAVAGLRKGKSDAREPEPVGPVPEATVEQTICHLSTQVAAMVRLQLLTGMRSGEVVILRGCDLDTGGGEVWTYRPHRHKTQHHGHAREIRLGPRARAILEPFLKRDLNAYLFSPAEAEAKRRRAVHAARSTPATCGNGVGSNRVASPARAPRDRYTVTSYRRAIARACDAAFPPPAELARRKVPGAKGRRWEAVAEWRARLGVDGWGRLLEWRQSHRWHPHQLRHTAATRLRRDYGIEAARIVLGHRSAAVTQIYAEADAQKAAEVMAEVG